jgi:signal transduction histidine kinase/DNA-binding response OmpR family regulator
VTDAERQHGERQLDELRRAVERYRSAVAELQLLNDIAVTAGTSIDVDQTLHEIIDRTLKAFGGEQGAILLLQEGGDRPFKTLVRQDERTRLRRHYDVVTSITGWVLKHEEAVLVADLREDVRFQSSPDERAQIRSALCAPIWFEGAIIGLITILNRTTGGRFSADDLTLLTIIAVQAGQLIKNAERRAESLQRMQEADAARWEAEKLRELDRLKSNLFAFIAHELRTPLTLILGPLEQLRAGTPSGDVDRLHALMQHQAARLLRRVNDLLTLSTIEAGTLALRISRCDLPALVTRAAASFEDAARARGLVLGVEAVAPGRDTYCDAEKLETVIINLLSNAVKFTPAGGRISLTAATVARPPDKAAEFRIVVADTGQGFSEDERRVLFRRFQRLPSAPIARSTGIGLALVKELVDIHHGSIDLFSSPGAGSTFTVTIPVERSFYEGYGITVLEEPPDASAGLLTAQAPGPTLPAPGRPRALADDEAPQILVVEDDDDLRGFLCEVLAAGYAVAEARDGEEALARAQEHMPDLVVSDVLMPRLDGLTLCSRLRGDERTSHIPVILLTSRTELDQKLEGLRTGADDYLPKPFSPRELVARVANLLERRRALRERYGREITLEPQGIAVSSADEAFLNRLLHSVEHHMGDTQFGVDQLAHDAAMSKTHLNRKLRALVDQSAHEFIRTIRLKRAARLLSGRSGNVSEIAYEVGFSNPSHFAEVFRHAFGCSPTEFARTHPDNT